jgi:hypothetical protein
MQPARAVAFAHPSWAERCSTHELSAFATSFLTSNSPFFRHIATSSTQRGVMCSLSAPTRRIQDLCLAIFKTHPEALDKHMRQERPAASSQSSRKRNPDERPKKSDGTSKPPQNIQEKSSGLLSPQDPGLCRRASACVKGLLRVRCRDNVASDQRPVKGIVGSGGNDGCTPGDDSGPSSTAVQVPSAQKSQQPGPAVPAVPPANTQQSLDQCLE